MSSSLSAPHLQNEEAAYAFVEARVWPEGPICPHCGCMDRIYSIKANADAKVRIGLKKCGDCRKQFTVKVGTIFESSHVKLHLWLQAMALITSSKKGISSNQLHRMLGVTLKTAWFMSHRIREAMRSGDLSPMGGNGGVVEVDETFIGHKQGVVQKRGPHHKIAIMGLIDRNTGQARTLVIDKLNAESLIPIAEANVARETRVMTDDFRAYRGLKHKFAEHGYTSHSAGRYVDPDDRTIHSNSIEGYFSIFKRGMRGVYQFCAEKHLHRYLAEFDFRYSNREAVGFNDAARADELLKGVVGKRLTYQTIGRRASGAAA